MYPPCSMVTASILPSLRASLSRRLVARGMTQSAVATRLGITQAMVSKYTRQNAPAGEEPWADWLAPLEDTLSGENWAEKSTGTLCRLCLAARESGDMCRNHELKDICPGCNLCMNFRSSTGRGKDRFQVLSDLDEALDILKGEDLSGLFPQVRLNIATCSGEASAIEDVASFPGRLTLVGKKVTAVSAPEFNASTHLASLLVSSRRTSQAVRAMANLFMSQAIEKAVARAGLRLGRCSATAVGDIVASRGVRLLPSECRDGDGFVVPPVVGVEGAIYLQAESARALASAICKVSRELGNL